MALDRLSLFFLCVTAVTQAAAPTASPYAKLPLAFERQGERYVARGNGYQIALQGGSAAIGLQSQDGSGSSITMDFVRSRKVSGTAGAELQGKVNYVRGNDPKQWRLGLSTYDSVAYRGNLSRDRRALPRQSAADGIRRGVGTGGRPRFLLQALG